MGTKGNPCQFCEERQMGCHSRCEKYGNWKKDYNENMMEYYKKREKEEVFYRISYDKKNKKK